MNNLTRKIIINTAGQIGAPAAVISVLIFSGIKNIALLLLLSFAAGALGNIVFTLLATLVLNLEKRLRYGRPGEFVVAFNLLAPGTDACHRAGGKGRSLALMFQEGFPIPDGCVALPEAFADGDLTPAAWPELQRELSRLRAGKNAAFAVRSSALQEDSARASFAGEFESVLDVRSDDEIRAALRKVLASLGSERVRSYAATRGMDSDESSLAVVIQKMVQPEFAGVLFTADPLTGDLAKMSGNFVEGLGEKLVSGQVSAKEFTIDRPSGAYHGPAELAEAARSLHRSAHEIENLFGCPQDIEWAAAGEKIFILQARPITTLNGYDPVTAVWNDSLRGNFLWSATNLMEACPEVLTPLTASLRSYLDEHGGPTLRVKNYSLNGIIGGRFYANVSVQVSAFARQFKGDARRAYHQISGWWGELPDGLEIPVLPVTSADWGRQVLPELLRSLFQFSTYRRKAVRFLAANRRRCADLRSAVGEVRSAPELKALWDSEIFPLYRDALIHVIAASSDAQFRLESELRELVGDEDANALLSNLSGQTAHLESLGPAAGLARVANGEMTREDYMEAYGHRGVNEPEIAWPRPYEDSGWLDRRLEEWRRAPVDVDALLQRQRERYKAAWQRFRVKYPSKAALIRRRLRKAASNARRREAVRSEATRVTGAVRAFALRAGSLLGLGGDIFFFPIDEVLEALSNGLPPETVKYLSVRRKTFEHLRALPPFPALIRGRFDPFAWAAEAARRSDLYDAGVQTNVGETVMNDGNILRGAPGALGVVEGVVRRLDSIEDSMLFQKGEVLVAPMTNIGWTPLFPRAAAIVTDLGAPLSHAAIVARELGIPAVVGCGDATMRLKTGDRVRVDGGKGLVEIL